MRYTVPFEEVELTDIAEVGGLIRGLSAEGVAVPRGFALTAQAFRDHLLKAGLAEHIYPALAKRDASNVAELTKLSAAIRRLILQAPLPNDIANELTRAYSQLSSSYGESETDVAVHWSGTAEDLPTGSLDGQQESYLDVRGQAALLEAVRHCMASLFTERAIAYSAERGFDHRKVALSVGVQKMVRPERYSSKLRSIQAVFSCTCIRWVSKSHVG